MATYEVTLTVHRDTWADSPGEAIEHVSKLLVGTGLYGLGDFTVTEVPDRDTVGVPPVSVGV
jgi:hypothetical protein